MPGRKPIDRAALVAALLLCGSMACAASAPPDASVRQLVGKLNSDQLAEREAAKVELSTARTLSLPDVEAMARSDELSPEQRLRLRQVARGLFRNQKLPGMGVQFGQVGAAGVGIQAVIEGFPAAKSLRPLDAIFSVNGQVMSTQDDLRWTILSYEPGDTLELGVLRDGVTQMVSVELGSFDALPNAIPPDDLDRARAFAIRWDRTVGSAPAPDGVIGDGLSVDRWAEVQAGGTSGNNKSWPLTRESASRMIGFGGQPRASLAVQQAFTQPAFIPEMSGSREYTSTVADVVDQIRSLSRQRAVVDQRAQTLEKHADATANPDQRDQFRSMRDQALQELVQIDQQLDAMREVLRQLRETGR